MHAWRIKDQPGPISSNPLEWVEVPVPNPGPGEVLVRVRACGVCRTDLHVSEGDLAVHRKQVTPGHEIVGQIVTLGEDSASENTTGEGTVGEDEETAESQDPERRGNGRLHVGEYVGIAWLRHTCGECDFCRSGAENLCQKSQYTGWDANGGYAEYAVAPADYAYPLDDLLDAGEDREAANGLLRECRSKQGSLYSVESVAPLLCAGIIGYRALKRTGLLQFVDDRAVSESVARGVLSNGNESAATAISRPLTLGLYGFGGSAHLTAQVALALGMRVHVLTRGGDARKLALELGCASAGGAYDMPPEKLDAAIIFAPVGDMIPVAMRALRPGGVLSLAGIHMSDVHTLNYENELFHEKEIRTVESNTRQDGREFLAFAARHHLDVDAHPYPLSQGQKALQDLKEGAFAGAAVLLP